MSDLLLFQGISTDEPFKKTIIREIDKLGCGCPAIPFINPTSVVFKARAMSLSLQ
jgi:hypothetical protein